MGRTEGVDGDGCSADPSQQPWGVFGGCRMRRRLDAAGGWQTAYGQWRMATRTGNAGDVGGGEEGKWVGARPTWAVKVGVVGVGCGEGDAGVVKVRRRYVLTTDAILSVEYRHIFSETSHRDLGFCSTDSFSVTSGTEKRGLTGRCESH